MENEELISANDFCTHHHIEVSFLQSLQDYGLVELQAVRQTTYLHPDQLSDVEKFMHLHFDLDINFEGMDVIQNMLQRMETMQYEMTALRNRLRLFEEGED